jgi:preprotein translocase subunit SecE
VSASVRPRTGRRPSEPSPLRFFRETYEELRKVSWPTPAELYRYTLIVIVTVVVLAAYVGAIDWALNYLAQHYIYAPITNK